MSNLQTVFSAAASQAQAQSTGDAQTVKSLNRSVLTTYVNTESDLGIFAPGSINTGSGQGAYAQVGPAESNRVPRIYGECVTGGVIVDSYRHDINTTSYVIVLSEHNATADQYRETNTSTPVNSWQIVGYDSAQTYSGAVASNNPEIYRDGELCKFWNTTVTARVTGFSDPLTGGSTTTPEIALSNAQIDVAVFAGGVGTSDCVFPPSPITATSLHPPAVSGTFEDLVFAVIKVKTDDDEDIRSLGEWKFRINNYASYTFTAPGESPIQKPANNPAIVLRDYLTNTRYGMAINPVFLDDTSFSAWENFCETDPYNASYSVYYLASARGIGHPPYSSVPGFLCSSEPLHMTVDGQINTNNTTGSNVKRICQTGQAQLNWDYPSGKFKVNFSQGQTAAARANIATNFNSDNIIGTINVNTTGLFDLVNTLDFSYRDTFSHGDQVTNRTDLSASERNVNEPDNTEDIALDLVTDYWRAGRLANVTLKDNRLDEIVTFTADHTTRASSVGDYVTLTDEFYGYDQAVFRIIKKTELTDAKKNLVYNYAVKEYSDAVFLPQIYSNNRLDGDLSNSVSDMPLGQPIIESLGVVDEFQTGVSINDQAARRWDVTYDSNAQVTAVTPVTGNALSVYFPIFGQSPQDASETVLAVKIADNESVTYDYTNTVMAIMPTGNNTMKTHVIAGEPVNMTYLDAPTSTSSRVITFPLNKLPAGFGATNEFDVKIYFLTDNYYPNLVSNTFSFADSVGFGIPLDVFEYTGSSVVDTYGPGSDLTQTVGNVVLNSGTTYGQLTTTHNFTEFEPDLYDLIVECDFDIPGMTDPTRISGNLSVLVDINVEFKPQTELSQRLFSGNVQWTDFPHLYQDLLYDKPLDFVAKKSISGIQLTGNHIQAISDISNLAAYINRGDLFMTRATAVMRVEGAVTYAGSPKDITITNFQWQIRPRNRMYGDYKI
jgi:hypothetical protein